MQLVVSPGSSSPVPASIEDLATLILNDISARGLAPGDRYLTADEARRRFGVRKATVNSAMRMLSQRELLVRRQRAGTFIGPRIDRGGNHVAIKPRLQKVYVLLNDERMPLYVTADDIIRGLWRGLSAVSVNFVRLDRGSDVERTRALIDLAASNGEKVGFLPISCSRGVYEVLATCGLPVAVLGSVDPQQAQHLPSIDADGAHAGRLIAEYLFRRDCFRRGCQRVVVVMPETWRHGDNLFFEAIRSAMGEAGLPLAALSMRSVPSDPHAIKQYIRSCLAAEHRPTAIVSRQGLLPQPAGSTSPPGKGIWVPRLIVESVRESGLSVPDDVAVVYHLDRDLPPDPLPLPCTHRLENWGDTLARVCTSLAEWHPRRAHGQEHKLLPVGFYEPSEQVH